MSLTVGESFANLKSKYTKKISLLEALGPYIPHKKNVLKGPFLREI